VFYCAGLTGDFVSRPLDAADAHVATVLRLVNAIDFDTFVYLSTTRVYGSGPTHEEAALTVRPGVMSDLYNITKLAGESTVLQALGGRGRVARLSNVVGPALAPTSFVGSLAEHIARGETVRIEAGPLFARDYVDVEDVVELLLRIPGGRTSIYNVASGCNVTNGEIAELIRGSGREVSVGDAAGTGNTLIETSRIRDEFGYAPRAPHHALSLALGHG
jgi:nucleoside-diphosphate-sugar epimerase